MAKTNDLKGVLAYFDTWEDVFDTFTDEETLLLFKAFLSYAQYGEITEFPDRAMKMAFKRLMLSADSDFRRYKEKSINAAYAAYSRDAAKRQKETGELPMTKEEWLKNKEV